MIGMFKKFFYEEDGLSTVEIVIIIAVLVGLALIFRKNIYLFVNQLFERIFRDAGSVTSIPGEGTEYKLGN